VSTAVVSGTVFVVVPQAQDGGPGEDGTLTLPGGTGVPFRTIRPDDVDALRRFHGRLGERTVYLRFFGSMKELSEQKAKYFASVDGVDHVAFVALDPQDPGEIVAVVRYDREGSEDREAEYAALVEDRWQDRGVGMGLTRELIGAARDKGVRCFYALVMGENKRMLELLRHLGLPERERRDSEHGVKRIEVQISSE
jgi:GNAT superfamily N-acetyltransferase